MGRSRSSSPKPSDDWTLEIQKRMALVRSLHLEKCRGIDHMEFTADGRYALATCEFSGQVVKIDLGENRVMGYLDLDPGRPAKESMPQDIRSSANGRAFYVADMMAGGVWIVDPYEFQAYRLS